MSEADSVVARVLPERSSVGATAAITRAFSAAAESNPLSVAAIVLVALLCFLPGFFTIPPIDRDEPNFSNASRTMYETGNLIDIRIQDQPRSKKPVGIYWLQAATVALTGAGSDAPIWIFRLPSLLGAIAAAVLTWWMALAFGRRRPALLAGLFMAASVLLSVEARLAKTDAVLLATVVLAQGSLLRLWLGRNPERARLYQGLFWTAIAAGILVKGPITPGIAGLTIIGLSLFAGSFAWVKRLAPLGGILLVAVLVAPWLIAITISSEGAFWQESLGRDLLGKIAAGRDTHGAPPGYFLAFTLVTFWPALPFLVLSLSRHLDQLRQPHVLFALCWVVPFWLICEAVPTKLPHYVLPAFPALALLAATAVEDASLRLDGGVHRFFAFAPVGVPATAAVVLTALFFHVEGRVHLDTVVLFALATAIGAVAWWLLTRRREFLPAAVVSLGAAFFAEAALFGTLAPNFTELQVSSRIVAAARQVAGCDRPALAASGFIEPSLLFLAGSDALLGGGSDAADFMAKPGCRVAAVEAETSADFLSRAADLGFEVVARTKVAGTNLSNGDRVNVTLYTRRSGP
ncbi:MAG: glycosyltransferase family 39 protein [Bauldia sp.]